MTQEQRQYMNQMRDENFELSTSHHYYGQLTVLCRKELPEISSHRNNVHKTSMEALDFARSWYTRCSKRHQNCRRSWPQNYHGPSRLVDIGMSDSSFWRLCEVDERDLEKTQYFTLSHCWGKSPLLQLNSSTIKTMKLGMPLSTLPRTFQDVIYIARRLGASYVWIDSLCIMQDSIYDWQQESAKMRDVYLYSACNIAATAATDITEECLFQRTEHSIDEPWNVQADPWAKIENYVVLDLHRLAAQVRDAPLSSRGWVVQERILSPRTLHMGRSQIFWECDEGLACEFWPEAIPKAFEGYFGSMFRNTQKELLRIHQTYSNDTHRSSIYRLWYDVVEHYSDCHLTKSSDKLVAISGIAKLFQSYLPGDAYISGLWKNDLAHGILWHSARYGPAPLVQVPGRAPTWSWASVDGSVKPQGRSSVIYNQAVLIQSINAETKHIAADPTGQVTECAVGFTGMLFECRFGEREPESPAGVFKPITLLGTAPNISGFPFPDTEIRSVFATRIFFCLPVLEFIWRQSHLLYGLMLNPVDDSYTVFVRKDFWFTILSNIPKQARVFGTIVDPFGELGRVDSAMQQQKIILI